MSPPCHSFRKIFKNSFCYFFTQLMPCHESESPLLPSLFFLLSWIIFISLFVTSYFYPRTVDNPFFTGCDFSLIFFFKNVIFIFQHCLFSQPFWLVSSIALPVVGFPQFTSNRSLFPYYKNIPYSYSCGGRRARGGEVLK